MSTTNLKLDSQITNDASNTVIPRNMQPLPTGFFLWLLQSTKHPNKEKDEDWGIQELRSNKPKHVLFAETRKLQCDMWDGATIYYEQC